MATFACSAPPPILAPLLSTAFLVLAGYAQAGIVLALAALLIAAGGLIAAKDMILDKR
jgi:hypothetical protein